MKLTCSQMEILLSFYIENELSPSLREQVEEHLKECNICADKYEMIDELFRDIKCNIHNDIFSDEEFTKVHRYDRNLNDKISAYIDNELTNEENVKIKKLAITNKEARKELEDSYNIRRLMSNSFKKLKDNSREDYVKSVLKQLELEEEISANFHPAIKLLVIFTLSVLILSAAVLISLSV